MRQTGIIRVFAECDDCVHHRGPSTRNCSRRLSRGPVAAARASRVTVAEPGPLHDGPIDQTLNGRIDVPHVDSRHEGTRSHLDEQTPENFVGETARYDADAVEIENNRMIQIQEIPDHAANLHSPLTRAEVTPRLLSHVERHVTPTTLECTLNIIKGRIMRHIFESESLIEQFMVADRDGTSNGRPIVGNRLLTISDSLVRIVDG